MATADLSGVKLHLVDSVEKAGEMMTWLSERRPHDVIAVDTETGELPGNDRKHAFSPWHGRLRLVQIGDGQTGWSIPWERWNGVFHEAMEKYQGELICHNIAFENKWFMVQSDFRIPWHRAHDTMIMSQIVNPLQSAALKSLTRRYVDSRASGLQQMLDQEMTENGWTWGTIPINNKKYYSYGALDCVLTVRLYEKLRKEIEPYKDVYDMEMAVRRVCSNMEFNGARVDVEYSRAQHERLGMHAQSVRDWVKDAYDINAASPTQLTKVFVDRLGGVVTETTPSGQPKMDKTQLQKFVIQGGGNELSVLAEQVLLMRKSAKLADTYFANFINGNIDGLMHPEIRTLGARTSRMSITSPALQTLPKGDKLVRKAFIPRNEGEVLVSADLEQVEFRMMAGLSRDPALVNLFQECDRTGDDAFTRIGQEVYGDPSMVKKDPRRAMMKTYVYGCVPLSTKIFTNRGWLAHDEVKVGDRTIGYNTETGKSEWTEVKGVHVFDEAEVFEFGNKHRSFLCTENHRWATTTGRPGNRRREAADDVRHAYDITGTERRVVHAAPFADQTGSFDITDIDARVLGWILSDGSIYREGEYHVRSSITQTKPDNLESINALVAAALGAEKAPHIVERTGQHVWNLPAGYTRELLGKVGVHDKKTFDPWRLALGLPASARAALLETLDLGDGKSVTRTLVVQAADSPVATLVEALAFLLGKYTSSYVVEPDGTGWQRRAAVVKTVGKGTMTCQRVSLQPHSKERVWCVTTGLGTWTMQEERGTGPVLTGNTMYGAGIATSAVNAGVPEHQMKEVAAAFNAQYPGVKTFMQQVEHAGMTRLRNEGEAYVKTKLGRRLPADEGRVYTLVNYCIQGGAAEVFKQDMLKADAAGLGDYFVVPVHDELVMSVPRAEAEEAGRVLQECMTTREGWPVELLAGAPEVGLRWGGMVEASSDEGKAIMREPEE